MKLSTKTRYGIRVMIELATKHGSGPVHLSQIAKNQALSDKYLEQIVSTLKVSGLVTAIRGAKGGYLLSKEPGEISAREVVESLEGPLNMVDCTGDETCLREEACGANKLWRLFSQNVKDFLQNITLNDLKAWQDECQHKNEYFI